MVISNEKLTAVAPHRTHTTEAAVPCGYLFGETYCRCHLLQVQGILAGEETCRSCSRSHGPEYAGDTSLGGHAHSPRASYDGWARAIATRSFTPHNAESSYGDLRALFDSLHFRPHSTIAALSFVEVYSAIRSTWLDLEVYALTLSQDWSGNLALTTRHAHHSQDG